MGTVVSIEITVSEGAGPAILEPVWEEAETLENTFSRYIRESEVSRINRRSETGPIEISRDLAEVLFRAGEISSLSRGAFDVTVAPLMRIWGFFPERKGVIPSPDEIKRALESADWRGINVDRKSSAVVFSNPDTRIDLAALAKGYAVDRITAALKERGVRSGLINAGGDIYGLGNRPGGGPWRIGVEHPRREGELITVLKLRNRAVATSGDYRNYFIRGKKRYSHIIDPRTGRPSETGIIEVSILAADCMTADALATAVTICGVEEGLELLNRLDDVEGLIVAGDQDDPGIYFSRGLDE